MINNEKSKEESLKQYRVKVESYILQSNENHSSKKKKNGKISIYINKKKKYKKKKNKIKR